MHDFHHIDSGADHLDLILATSEIGIWALDVVTGKAVRNLRHDQIFGYEKLLDDWSGDIFLSYVVEEDRARVGSLLNVSIQTGKPWSFETRIRRADGADRWISARGIPKFSPQGNVTKIIGHVIDITETKYSEDRLKLLAKELNHRVSNAFTIMNSIVRHTAKRTDSVEVFAESLMERLGALSRANRVLVADKAQRLSLRSIFDMELEAFATWQGRISITGITSVWFSGQASEALSMIFHELLTNAVKHGALSVPDGHVYISIDSADPRQIRIRWAETGGPPIAGALDLGIGSTILQNALRDEGSVTIDYRPDGLICDIIVHDSFRRGAADAEVTLSPLRAAGQPGRADTALVNRRIMIVEDDPIIGMDLADIFKSRGARVAGPFTTLAAGLHALETAPDAALLDVNLGHETTDAIALRLSAMSIPFLILSGQADTSDLGQALHGALVIAKPFREQDLVTRMTELVWQRDKATPKL